MALAQISYLIKGQRTFDVEFDASDCAELDKQFDIEKETLHYAHTYDEIVVSCLELDYYASAQKG